MGSEKQGEYPTNDHDQRRKSILSSASSGKSNKTEAKLSDLDVFLKLLGTPGRYQIISYVAMVSLYFLIAPSNLAMIFLGAEPSELTCTTDKFVSNWQNRNTSTVGNVSFIAVEPTEDKQCLLKRNWTDKKAWKQEEIQCKSWIFPTVENKLDIDSVANQFQLVCNDKWKVSLASTIYFIGNVIGAIIFGYLGDLFGRRLVVLSTTAGTVIFGCASAFAPNYIGFVSLRFILGCLMQGVQVFYPLVMEWFPSYQRAILGTLSECFWGFGVMTLALWGYVFLSWQSIQLAISITGLVLLVIHFFLIEDSLRWLLVSDRGARAAQVTKKVLRINSLPEMSTTMEKQLMEIGTVLKEKEQKLHYTFIDCFRTPKLRKITLCMIYIHFCISLGYYGLSFSFDQLVGSLALNLFIGGALEMIPYIACAFAVPRYGRRLPLVVLNGFSGIMCIIAGVIPTTGAGSTARTVLALLGRMSISGSFCSVAVWTTELFPTVLRSNGLGMAMMGLRIGSVISPQIVLLGHYTFEQLPVIVIGVSVIVGAGLSFLLKETLHKESLPDTVQDVEESDEGTPLPAELSGAPTPPNSQSNSLTLDNFFKSKK